MKTFNRNKEAKMHAATCSECGKNCEVPFEPSPDKPIYCANCYEKEYKSGFSKTAKSKKKNENILDKLDRIIAILEDMKSEREG